MTFHPLREGSRARGATGHRRCSRERFAPRPPWRVALRHRSGDTESADARARSHGSRARANGAARARVSARAAARTGPDRLNEGENGATDASFLAHSGCASSRGPVADPGDRIDPDGSVGA